MIEIRAVIQYLIIYILLLVQGTAFESNHHDFFQIVIFFLGISYCYKRTVSKSTLSKIMVIALSLLVSCIVTQGSMTLGSIITLINTFLIVMCAYKLCPEKIAERAVKLICLFSLLSLVFYTAQMLNPEFLRRISIPYTYNTGDQYWQNGSRVDLVIYFNFLFSYNPYAQRLRNCGIFTEPGVYAMVLTAALFLLLYNKDKFEMKSFKRYLIILIVTMVSVQSAMGFICLAIIFAYVLMNKRENMGNIKKVLILAGVAVLLVSIYQGTESIIYRNLLSKIYDFDASAVDLSVSTGKSRLESIRADMSIALQNPFGVGYRDYTPLWNSIKENIPDRASCVGLTKNFAVFGFIPVIYTLVYYCNVFRNKNKMLSVCYCICLIIIYLSQPNLYSPILMLVSYMADKIEDAVKIDHGLEVAHEQEGNDNKDYKRLQQIVFRCSYK